MSQTRRVRLVSEVVKISARYRDQEKLKLKFPLILGKEEMVKILGDLMEEKGWQDVSGKKVRREGNIKIEYNPAENSISREYAKNHKRSK